MGALVTRLASVVSLLRRRVGLPLPFGSRRENGLLWRAEIVNVYSPPKQR
jgi:hypothetical protein